MGRGSDAGSGKHLSPDDQRQAGVGKWGGDRWVLDACPSLGMRADDGWVWSWSWLSRSTAPLFESEPQVSPIGDAFGKLVIHKDKYPWEKGV